MIGEALDNQLKTIVFYSPGSDSQMEKGREVSKKQLLNVLNYTNFQDSAILINFKHLKYGNIISLQAKPQPCLGDILDCLWVKKEKLTQKLSAYKLLNFLLPDGQRMIMVEADLNKINEEGISFNLPEICYEISTRKTKRHPCKDIKVTLVQHSAIFNGYLRDFSAVSFGVEISIAPPQTFNYINAESSVYVTFKNETGVLYTGECRIIKQTSGQKTRSFVLEPLNNQIRRFKPKELRSLRQKFSPSPNIIFRHPLTQKTITLSVEDLSGSGFLTEEYYDNSVLLPGMIIPQLDIEFANDFKIRCRAQVVYKDLYATEEEKICVKCGIAILDMDVQDQVRLSSLLHHATNRKSYVCNVVDLDDLWKFFFETGFFYPKKYASIHTNKEKFKGTYEKLYIHNPHIARHFIYQDKGIIQGHISMLRFYENTWLIQHHAATRSKKAGLTVLEQTGRYINDFRYLYSAHMDFLACYFRPDNKFPNHIFGNFTKDLNDPKGSSIDSFAYFNFTKATEEQDLSESWKLFETQPDDLAELEGFYEYTSGGLMPYALDLEPDTIDSDTLTKEYERSGFKREKILFSLKKDGFLKAIIMVNISDFGLNMSNLTNCVHIIVLDSDDLPRNVLYSTLSRLSRYYDENEITVLLYPLSYAETRSIPYEKIYNLWVINTQYGDHYLKYMGNLLNRPRNK